MSAPLLASLPYLTTALYRQLPTAHKALTLLITSNLLSVPAIPERFEVADWTIASVSSSARRAEPGESAVAVALFAPAPGSVCTPALAMQQVLAAAQLPSPIPLPAVWAGIVILVPLAGRAPLVGEDIPIPAV